MMGSKSKEDEDKAFKYEVYIEIFLKYLWMVLVWGIILTIPLILIYLSIIFIFDVQTKNIDALSSILGLLSAIVTSYIALIKTLNSKYKNFTIQIERIEK